MTKDLYTNKMQTQYTSRDRIQRGYSAWQVPKVAHDQQQDKSAQQQGDQGIEHMLYSGLESQGNNPIEQNL